MNRAGDLIPHQRGNETVSGYTSDDEKKTNKKWFFYRKNDLKAYVDNANQSTEKVVLSKGKNVKEELKGKTGIVFFENLAKDGSTGTVTLWDGKEFVKLEHDKSGVAEQTTLFVLK